MGIEAPLGLYSQPAIILMHSKKETRMPSIALAEFIKAIRAGGLAAFLALIHRVTKAVNFIEGYL